MEKNEYSKRVTVVIVMHNSARVIGQCLNSIPRGVRVCIVDNASVDGSAEVAFNARPDAVIVKSPDNLGFGRGNNLALAKVGTEFAFILNPDTVMREDTIEKLLQAADNYPNAAITAPIMYSADGNIQKTYKNSVFSRESGKSHYIVPEGDLCADFMSGAAMLLRMRLFKETGFFDPEIFLFYEDDDICLKVRKAGYSLVQTPSASLTHLMGKSSPPTLKYIYIKNWHTMWSRLYLERKYKGNGAAQTLAAKEMLRQLGKAIGHLFILDNNKIIKSIARLVAVFAFVLGVRAVPKEM
jgi:N-acetylglucosaminyl-diphospho-decaprenol L-rhamnosyltransferase